MLLLGANVEGHEHRVTPFDARVGKTTGGVKSSEKSDHNQVNSGGASTSSPLSAPERPECVRASGIDRRMTSPPDSTLVSLAVQSRNRRRVANRVSPRTTKERQRRAKPKWDLATGPPTVAAAQPLSFIHRPGLTRWQAGKKLPKEGLQAHMHDQCILRETVAK